MTTTVEDLSSLQTIPILRAAKLLGLGRTRTYELVAKGQFPVPVKRIGREYRVRISDVEKFLTD